MRVKWSEPQLILHQDRHRFQYLRKGRRFGATTFKAQQFCLNAFNGQKLLWVETNHRNIVRYVERMFIPFLKEFPKGTAKWYKQDKVLKIGAGLIDFGSAEAPEAMEGEGYDEIFLNEAGIILDGDQGEYLYYNVLLPMLADSPDSRLSAYGVPKGENLFADLLEDAETDTNSIVFNYSGFDNPFIDHATLRMLEQKMGEGTPTARQEIWGEIVRDTTGLVMYSWDAKRHVREIDHMEGYPLLISIDVNVEPMSAIITQAGTDFHHTLDTVAVGDTGIDQVKETCRLIREMYPGETYLLTGDASGHSNTVQSVRTVYDAMQRYLGITPEQIVAPRKNMSLQDSRTLCNSLLSTLPEVYVHPRCEVLIREMSRAVWERGKIKKDRKEHKNDMLDAWRYSVHHAFPYYVDFMDIDPDD